MLRKFAWLLVIEFREYRCGDYVRLKAQYFIQIFYILAKDKT